jgi:hypothetical protein
MSQQKVPGIDAPTVIQSAMVELAFGVVGLVFILAVGRSVADSLGAPTDRLAAASVGRGLGLALGGVFGVGVTRPMFADRVRPFLARFTSSKPTFANFAIIGLAAALGEETLFRATIQPSAGILIAALLFTIAHAAIADFRHPSAGKLAYALLALGMGSCSESNTTASASLPQWRLILRSIRPACVDSAAVAGAFGLDRPGQEHVLGILGAAAEREQVACQFAQHRLLIRVDLAFVAVDEVDPVGIDTFYHSVRHRGQAALKGARRFAE